MDWTKPKDIDAVDAAWGISDVEKFMPAYDDIPKDFPGRERWERVVSDWFFSGIKISKAVPRPGVDHAKAVRHLGAILRSWEPSHEHKTIGTAYLMSLWYDTFEYECGNRGR